MIYDFAQNLIEGKQIKNIDLKNAKDAKNNSVDNSIDWKEEVNRWNNEI